MYTVYKTVCLVNQKFYIGVHKTENPNDGYLGSGNLIKAAIVKYGKENFRKEILFVSEDARVAYEIERSLVNQFLIESEDCYNLKLGGEGGFDLINSRGLTSGIFHRGENLTHADRVNAAKATQTKYWSDEEFRTAHRERLIRRNAQTPTFNGIKSHSGEAKRKIGEANALHQRGVGNSQFGTKWMYHAVHGNKKVRPGDFQEYLDSGWIFGRIIH